VLLCLGLLLHKVDDRLSHFHHSLDDKAAFGICGACRSELWPRDNTEGKRSVYRCIYSVLLNRRTPLGSALT